MTRVVGIDLSLTSTGVVVVESGIVTHLARIESAGKAGATLAERSGRLSSLRQQVMRAALGPRLDQPVNLAVIEGPSFGSRNPGSAHDRSGLWWDVVASFHRIEVPVAEVPPKTRAKYATGSGAAAKDAVLAAVVRRYPSVDVTGNDVADALVLAAMGARHLGEPVEQLPAVHVTALSGVRWPGPGDVPAILRPAPAGPVSTTAAPPGQLPLTIGDDD